MPRPHHRKDDRSMNANLNKDSETNHKRGYRSVYGSTKRRKRSVYVSTQFRPTTLVSLPVVVISRPSLLPSSSHADSFSGRQRVPGWLRLSDGSTGLVANSRVCVRRENHFGGVFA